MLSKKSTNLKPLPSCIAQTCGKQLYAKGAKDEFLWERLLELGIAPGLFFILKQGIYLNRWNRKEKVFKSLRCFGKKDIFNPYTSIFIGGFIIVSEKTSISLA